MSGHVRLLGGRAGRAGVLPQLRPGTLSPHPQWVIPSMQQPGMLMPSASRPRSSQATADWTAGQCKNTHGQPRPTALATHRQGKPCRSCSSSKYKPSQAALPRAFMSQRSLLGGDKLPDDKLLAQQSRSLQSQDIQNAPAPRKHTWKHPAKPEPRQPAAASKLRRLPKHHQKSSTASWLHSRMQPAAKLACGHALLMARSRQAALST